MIDHKRLIFGAYTPLLFDDFDTVEQQIKDLAEVGINYAVLSSRGFGHQDFRTLSEEQKRKVFDMLAEYDIDGVFSDFDISKRVEINGSNEAHMFDITKMHNADYYKDSPGFAGNAFVDEPGYEHFPELGKTVKEYYEAFPGKHAYINLLPKYANEAQLRYGAWMAAIEYFDTSTDVYQKHLDEYIKYVPTDYICADVYPCLHSDAKGDYTFEKYMDSVEMVANAARESGRKFWCCLQTAAWASWVKVPEEHEIRWQYYALLSLGCTAFFSYVYASRRRHFGMCVNGDLTKNEMFNICKRTINEFKRLESAYLAYESLGTYSHNYSENVPWLRLNKPYKGETPIKEIVCDDPLLIGVFKAKEGSSKAFTLVNMTDPIAKKTVNLKIKCDGKLTPYYSGIPCTIYPIDGYYNFTLTTGDGIFVTVE